MQVDGASTLLVQLEGARVQDHDLTEGDGETCDHRPLGGAIVDNHALHSCQRSVKISALARALSGKVSVLSFSPPTTKTLPSCRVTAKMPPLARDILGSGVQRSVRGL